MGSDNYDDLDDLLDDNELQSKILAKSPHDTHTAEPYGIPDVSKLHVKAETESKAPNAEQPKQADKDNKESVDALPKELEDLLQASGDDKAAQEALKSLLTGFANEESQEAPSSFEDTISATMDRLNQSKKSNGSSGEVDEAALMEKLLQDMQKSISQDAGNGSTAGGLDGLLSSLLSELSSKEVLYEPLKELHTGYPDWLAENSEKLEKTELERLKKQQKIVADIITKFEHSKYSDSDQKSRDYITQKMLEMQDTGAPPKELVGDVAGGAFPGIPGIGGSSPDIPGDCATQ